MNNSKNKLNSIKNKLNSKKKKKKICIFQPMPNKPYKSYNYKLNNIYIYGLAINMLGISQQHNK